MARYDRAAAARAADAAVDATLVGVTALTMHRLFATCMQLGMKTASDHFVKNAYVARLVGMTLAELNALELELAVALDFRCHATCAEMCELPSALAATAAPEGARRRMNAAQCRRGMQCVLRAFTSPSGSSGAHLPRPVVCRSDDDLDEVDPPSDDNGDNAVAAKSGTAAYLDVAEDVAAPQS